MTAQPCLAAIYGPTGSGKSALAEAMAGPLSARLVSADAFQVYRRFSIGTGKPAPPHSWLGVDLVDPDQSFGVVEFIQFALPLLEESFARGQNVIIAGGTGQYMRALLEEFSNLGALPPEGLRKELMAREQEEGLESLVKDLCRLNPTHKVDVKNPVRVRRALERLLAPGEPLRFSLPPYKKVKFGLSLEPDDLAEMQKVRIRGMFDAGWAVEVEGLMAEGTPDSAPAWRAIGYEVVKKAVLNQSSLTEAEIEISLLHRQYAKRQRTWLRREPSLQWVQAPSIGSGMSDLAQELLSHIRAGK